MLAADPHRLKLPLQHLDPRILQINLTGFLEKNASLFVKARPASASAAACMLTSSSSSRSPAMQELWSLLASAGQNPSGVPQRLLDEKAEELRRKKEPQDKINVSTLV